MERAKKGGLKVRRMMKVGINAEKMEVKRETGGIGFCWLARPFTSMDFSGLIL